MLRKWHTLKLQIFKEDCKYISAKNKIFYTILPSGTGIKKQLPFLKVVKSPEDEEMFLNVFGRMTEHLKGSSALLSFLKTIKN